MWAEFHGLNSKLQFVGKGQGFGLELVGPWDDKRVGKLCGQMFGVNLWAKIHGVKSMGKSLWDKIRGLKSVG